MQDEEWGTGANPDRIEEALRADKSHEIKGVLVVHNETATGVTSNVAGVRRALDAAKHPALLYVDGVSAIGSIDFRFDDWGVDLAITGSQKGLMLPAGLGIVCVSKKALAAMRDGNLRTLISISAIRSKPTPPATSPTRRRCRCFTACARRSTSSMRKAWRTSLPATIILRAGRAPRSRRGVSESAFFRAAGRLLKPTAS